MLFVFMFIKNGKTGFNGIRLKIRLMENLIDKAGFEANNKMICTKV